MAEVKLLVTHALSVQGDPMQLTKVKARSRQGSSPEAVLAVWISRQRRAGMQCYTRRWLVAPMAPGILGMQLAQTLETIETK